MTKEEAVNIIKERIHVTEYVNSSYVDCVDIEALRIAIKALAQPEIVRCKDCRWKEGSECVRFSEVRPFPDDFCSRAERKEGEPNG